MCGKAEGTINAKGNPIHMNAHHIEDKANQTLRFDIMNGVCLCPTHHKFGNDSAHRSPVWFIEWLRMYAADRYRHVWSARCLPPPDREGVDELFKVLSSYVR